MIKWKELSELCRCALVIGSVIFYVIAMVVWFLEGRPTDFVSIGIVACMTMLASRKD